MSDPPRFEPPSPEAVAKVRALAERRLGPDEFQAYVSAPVSAEERAETVAGIRWFTRRYPTPAERLASARRAYAQLARRMPPAG